MCPLLIYQGKLNMINRDPMEQGITDYCAEQGIGFISFSPLAQGLLTDRYLHGVPTDSRMAQGKFLKQEQLTPELLSWLNRLNNKAPCARKRWPKWPWPGIAAEGHHQCAGGRQQRGTAGENLRCVQHKPFSEADLAELAEMSPEQKDVLQMPASEK
jgi:L-glyceraldehyde 3-phosphate reductase